MTTTDQQAAPSPFVQGSERVILDATANLLAAIAERISDRTYRCDLDTATVLNFGTTRGKIEVATTALRHALIALDVSADHYPLPETQRAKVS